MLLCIMLVAPATAQEHFALTVPDESQVVESREILVRETEVKLPLTTERSDPPTNSWPSYLPHYVLPI